MEIKNIHEYKLNDIILISSLPDMGKVGGLVTQHISKKLETKKATQMLNPERKYSDECTFGEHSEFYETSWPRVAEEACNSKLRN